MRLESNLCHISENKSVVLVKGWIDNEIIGSALGEGPTAEIAEDNAINRLIQRLNKKEISKINIEEKREINIPVVNKINTNTLTTMNEKQERKIIPTDWSKELTEIDSEIQRLNWSREDESSFLENEFGYNNRYMITNYNELVNYLNKLKEIKHQESFHPESPTKQELIDESEKILNEISWDHNIGREYLMKEFNVSTRKGLNRSQLISFIKKLKLIKNKSKSNI